MDDIKWNGFLRQRRALLAVSLVLAFSQFAGLTLKKISFLGNELEVGYPIAVNIALWVFWGYWLYRFYVYSGEVGAVTTTSQRYQSKLYHLLKEQASVLFQYDQNISARLKEQDAKYTGASCHGVELYGYSEEGYRIGTNRIDIEYVKTNGDRGVAQYGDTKTVVPHEHIRPLKRQAARYVMLHTPVATDFWLPYFVAAVPLVIAVFQGMVMVIRHLEK